jgi:peptide/nickel transport system substrate-binding protein
MRKVLIFALVLLIGLSASAAFAVRSGGTLNTMAPYGGDLYGLDLHKSTRYQDWLVGINIHRGLYKWDTEKNVPVLDLAENVSVSDDGRVFTYKLRPNIKFHNGRQLVADDIIWSYTRVAAMKPDSPQLRYIKSIKGVDAVNEGKDKTISGLKKIDDLTFEMALENPVGCGPFKFVKWVKGSEVVVEKVDDFYLEGRPYLDKIVYKIMGEAAPRDLAFKAKELDVTLVGAVNYPEYKADPEISKNMIEVAEMFTRLVGFNPDFKPLGDKRVRQAINHAIPADLIIKKILKGKAFPARGYLPTTSPAFNPNIKKYDFNLEKAKQLMKEAGYEKGFTIEQAIGTANKSWGTGIYEAALPYLKKIGIELKIQQMEGAAMAERIRNADYQMFIWSLDSGPDPLEVLRRWSSDITPAAGNYVKYNNPEFDKYISMAEGTRDQNKIMEYIQKAEEIFVEDAPIWFFNYNKAVLAKQPWVNGIVPVAPEMMFQDMTSVWVDETSPRANMK